MKLAKNIISILIVIVFLFWTGYLLGQRSIEIAPYNYTISDNSVMSAYEALQWIDRGIYSHQYYLIHPEFQTDRTGDTQWQIETIAEYQRARELIRRISGN